MKSPMVLKLSCFQSSFIIRSSFLIIWVPNSGVFLMNS
ncbi:Usherin [Frankliniella fusca]|uniref:Usherin n=1 Tax=Frankliniella fusca TaxID=407009 RepID=A0AAE1L610_9NEOP|nr:Usherin [Frankliniella fusca]